MDVSPPQRSEFRRPARTDAPARLHSLLLSCLVSILAATTAACIRPFYTDPRTILSAVSAVRDLSVNEADLGLQVRVRGVVTYSNPRTNRFVVQDSTGGCFVDRSRIKTTITPGREVDV